MLRSAALDLWDAASHREERYAAMALLALRPVRGRSRDRGCRRAHGAHRAVVGLHRRARTPAGGPPRPPPRADGRARRGDGRVDARPLDPAHRDPLAARPGHRGSIVQLLSEAIDAEYSATASSSSARRSAGRFGSTRASTPTGCAPSPPRTSSARSAGARRSSTSATRPRQRIALSPSHYLESSL